MIAINSVRRFNFIRNPNILCNKSVSISLF